MRPIHARDEPFSYIYRFFFAKLKRILSCGDIRGRRLRNRDARRLCPMGFPVGRSVPGLDSRRKAGPINMLPRYFFPVAVVQGKAISLWLRCLDGGFSFLYIAAEHLAEEPCRTCVHAIPAALCKSKDGRLRKFRRWRPHSRAPWLVWSRTMSVRGWLSDLLNGTGGRAWPVRSLPDRGSIAARNNGNINSGPQNSEQFSILC